MHVFISCTYVYMCIYVYKFFVSGLSLTIGAQSLWGLVPRTDLNLSNAGGQNRNRREDRKGKGSLKEETDKETDLQHRGISNPKDTN